jgi:hypothetical protein
MAVKKPGALYRPPDAVFDRACHVEVRSDERLLLADRMLADMVMFDAMAVHDGVLIALDVLTADEREQALSGFRYFGLHSAAETVELIADRAKTLPVEADAESAFDREMEELYALAVPDTAVAEAFEARYSRSPNDFAKLTSEDISRYERTVTIIKGIGVSTSSHSDDPDASRSPR